MGHDPSILKRVSLIPSLSHPSLHSIIAGIIMATCLRYFTFMGHLRSVSVMDVVPHNPEPTYSPAYECGVCPTCREIEACSWQMSYTGENVRPRGADQAEIGDTCRPSCKAASSPNILEIYFQAAYQVLSRKEDGLWGKGKPNFVCFRLLIIKPTVKHCSAPCFHLSVLPFLQVHSFGCWWWWWVCGSYSF